MKKRYIALSVIIFLVIFLFKVSSVFCEGDINKVISNSYSVVLTWVTDKPSTSQIEYGTNNTYNNKTQEDTNLVIYHKVTIAGLMPSTTYNYRIISKDAYGNQATSGNLKFATLKEPPKDQPPQISDVEADTIIAAGPPEGPMGKNPTVSTSDKPDPSQESKVLKDEEPIKKALMQKGGILMKKGTWNVQPGLTYIHTSANRINIEGYTILPVLVIGEISTAEVKRDIFIQSLTTKYGLKNDLQLEFSVPYRFQYDRESIASPVSETTRNLSGLGDISGGAFYQFAYEKGVIPDAIIGVTAKSRTGKEPYNTEMGIGTGHWGIKTSLVAVKSSDPAILFASLGYTHNIGRNIENYGDVKPGDSFDYGFGAAFALNYQLALSMQLSQSITTKMDIDDSSVPGSFNNVISLKYGLTWSMSKNFSFDVSATHGLTTDAPDMILEVRFPFKF